LEHVIANEDLTLTSKYVEKTIFHLSYKNAEIEYDPITKHPVYSKKIKPLKPAPQFHHRIQANIAEKQYKSPPLGVSMSAYEELSLEAMKGTIVVPMNMRPAPDLIQLILGSEEEISQRSVGDNLKLVTEGIIEHFEFTYKNLYSTELSYVYEKRLMNKLVLSELFAAFAAHLNVPVRTNKGLVLRMKSKSKVEDISLRDWVEFYVPEMGWIPCDIQQKLHDKSIKDNYIGPELHDEIIRLEFAFQKHIPLSTVMFVNAKAEVNDGEPFFDGRKDVFFVKDMGFKILK